ncbi:hypothetical protein NB069_10415 [Leclercia adecarboxylata]|uniref:hypothetical protein n=1 Tax=Leclercia adecarboxylata TaxID=83655 RepID=UPI00202A2B85|nr:hypothetical protein [Leclercia adecarboxylata]URO01252.1 hypothetical protein NB069_10415 [Leclercia adecarboxylata]
MRKKTWGFIPKLVYVSVTCVFCLTTIISFALFALLGLGIVELSDTAIRTLGGMTIALVTLMRTIVKLAGQVMLHGS